MISSFNHGRQNINRVNGETIGILTLETTSLKRFSIVAHENERVPTHHDFMITDPLLILIC